ncbi:32825_t:CDS:2 [Gigaspora margarita]|uniref:32825_t:CDS:1 n=1 Tax=Gigaspora margarita TaxID=4874 RepID=A0ABN7WWY1_GIGMA|nr:32825_t:CDS:2 [Gigaspora margarita]
MINQLESRHATIADCYVALIKIVSAINHLPDANLFKSKAVKIYNLWFKEFATPLYQLRGQFNQISETAATMWQELGYDEASCWLSIDAQKDVLVELAIKIFSISLSQAVCEQNFSILKWIFGDCRTRLNIYRLEVIVKIRAFCYTNIKSELNFYGKELLECDLRDSVNGSTVILAN